MRPKTLLTLAITAALGMPLFAGCAHKRSPFASTDTTLALRRVVLYRNGVGYFEREGEVDEDILRIRVRRDQVNDLLKSLTVVDEKGKAVSISMPLDPESWANAALASLGPGRGSLASVLDNLRGTEVILGTFSGRVRGRIVMVERIVNEPDPERTNTRGGPSFPSTEPERDFKVTLLDGRNLEVVRLSKVRTVELRDGDLALQLHRRLDASAGEGMFQQIEVDIRLTGAKNHKLLVSYVVAAPMWKPTYRVILPDSGRGQALLQGWAVVDNLSGEDWRDVDLALTSGEPIAFRYDLHTPRTIDRTDLTEAGVRKRARVAVGETTFLDDEDEEEGEEEAEPAKVAEHATEADLDDDFAANRERRDKKAKKKKASRPRSAPKPSAVAPGAAGGPSDTPAADEQQRKLDYDALRRSTLATARAQQVSGLTRYDLGEKITVPNGSSTMVAIMNETVEAEETFLYKPGGAGIGYDSNPYRVVRFRNTTPFVLEPGPISIYAGGSFVGEGLSEAVGTTTSATIPFAVEPSILVSSQSKRSGDEMHLLRIVRGVLEVESFSRTTTTWTVKGQKRKDGFKVLVRHPKAGWNYAIKDKPPGTEELPDAYLVPVKVASGKTEGSLEIVEETPSRTSLSIWDARAVGLLEKLLLSTELTPATRKKLEPVVKLRQEIGRVDTEIDGLKRQQIELDQRANETRQNLQAIKKDAAASALRRKLNKRLEEFTSKGDEIGRKVVELQSSRLDKKIQLEDLIQNLDLRAPEKKKKSAAQPRSAQPKSAQPKK